MTKRTPGSIGFEAETACGAFLEARGIEILQRNFRCKQGELDLIAKEGDTLLFVEVRYRKNTRFGTPGETVGSSKQAKLLATAQVFLSQHPWANKLAARFDVISVTGNPSRGQFDWIKNAFSA